MIYSRFLSGGRIARNVNTDFNFAADKKNRENAKSVAYNTRVDDVIKMHNVYVLKKKHVHYSVCEFLKHYIAQYCISIAPAAISR